MKEKRRLILTILIFACIFVLLIRWLPSIGSIVTTSPSTPMRPSEFTGDNVIYPDADFETVGISKETVTALLNSYSVPTNLDMSLTYTLSPSNADSLTQRISYSKRGSRETVRYYSDADKLLTVYTVTSSGVSVSDNVTGESYTLPKSSVFTAMNLMHLPDYDWFYSASASNIRDMRFTELGEQEALYIEYYYPRLSQTERYWISTRYGTVLRSESLLNGRTYLTVNVTDIK